MRKLKFSESKIAAILKELEAGVAATELARKHGVSANTIYQWRSKFGGMSVSDMQRLRRHKGDRFISLQLEKAQS